MSTDSSFQESSGSEDGSNPPVPIDCCKVCGKKCDTYHEVHGTYCEEHCPDHEYEYDRGERASFCKHCNARRPDDWYED